MKAVTVFDLPARAGRYVQQPTGDKAFIPRPLPPEPALVLDGELQTLLSAADREKLLDALMQQPLVSPKRIAEIVGCSHPTATKLARDLEARGWLREVTGFERNRLYRYQPYLALFHREAVEAAFTVTQAQEATPAYRLA